MDILRSIASFLWPSQGPAPHDRDENPSSSHGSAYVIHCPDDAEAYIDDSEPYLYDDSYIDCWHNRDQTPYNYASTASTSALQNSTRFGQENYLSRRSGTRPQNQRQNFNNEPEINYYTNNELKRLNANDFNALSNAQLAQLHVRILNKLPVATLTRLDARVVNKLPDSSLNRLKAFVLNKLPDGSLKRLKARVVNKLSNTSLNLLKARVVNKLSDASLKILDARALNRLSAISLQNLTTRVVEKLPDAVLRNLKKHVLDHLSDAAYDHLRARLDNNRYEYSDYSDYELDYYD